MGFTIARVVDQLVILLDLIIANLPAATTFTITANTGTATAGVTASVTLKGGGVASAGPVTLTA